MQAKATHTHIDGKKSQQKERGGGVAKQYTTAGVYMLSANISIAVAPSLFVYAFLIITGHYRNTQTAK